MREKIGAMREKIGALEGSRSTTEETDAHIARLEVEKAKLIKEKYEATRNVAELMKTLRQMESTCRQATNGALHRVPILKILLDLAKAELARCMERWCDAHADTGGDFSAGSKGEIEESVASLQIAIDVSHTEVSKLINQYEQSKTDNNRRSSVAV